MLLSCPIFEYAGRHHATAFSGRFNGCCAAWSDIGADYYDDNWDKYLAGSAITQAHPIGYPLYRPVRQSLGSLERRLRNCMIGTRA
jgi:hypothetical protein